jgi:hypothetical protein
LIAPLLCEAFMRTAKVVAVALVIGGLSSGAQACNARGEFCEHPGWAANAFASSDDRVPDYWPEYATNDVTFGYVAPSSDNIAPKAYGYVARNVYAPTYGFRRDFRYGRAYGYAPAYGPPYSYIGPGRE